MNYYPQPDSHIRDQVKVVLDLSNYAAEKELNDPTGVDTPNLAAKKDFSSLKAEVDKLNAIKFAYIPTGLNNLKTNKANADDLEVSKFKIAPIDLKKVSNVVSKKVWHLKFNTQIWSSKFNKVSTKVNSLDNKIPEINQYNTDNQNLKKKIGDPDKKNTWY